MLNLIPLPDVQGTAKVPVTVHCGSVLAAQVDKSAGYYKVSGLTPGASYTVELTGLTDDVDLFALPGGTSTSAMPVHHTDKTRSANPVP